MSLELLDIQTINLKSNQTKTCRPLHVTKQRVFENLEFHSTPLMCAITSIKSNPYFIYSSEPLRWWNWNSPKNTKIALRPLVLLLYDSSLYHNFKVSDPRTEFVQDPRSSCEQKTQNTMVQPYWKKEPQNLNWTVYNASAYSAL